jgi:mRNA interferase RelE/StbE
LKIEFRRSFSKDLKQIQDKALLKRVQEIVEEIETAATLHEIASVKKLRGSESYYRIRVGDYRVGLRIEAETVIFVRFLHRRDIYRYFP